MWSSFEWEIDADDGRQALTKDLRYFKHRLTDLTWEKNIWSDPIFATVSLKWKMNLLNDYVSLASCRHTFRHSLLHSMIFIAYVFCELLLLLMCERKDISTSTISYRLLAKCEEKWPAKCMKWGNLHWFVHKISTADLAGCLFNVCVFLSFK